MSARRLIILTVATLPLLTLWAVHATMRAQEAELAAYPHVSGTVVDTRAERFASGRNASYTRHVPLVEFRERAEDGGRLRRHAARDFPRGAGPARSWQRRQVTVRYAPRGTRVDVAEWGDTGRGAPDPRMVGAALLWAGGVVAYGAGRGALARGVRGERA